MTPNTDVIKNGTANFCKGAAKEKSRKKVFIKRFLEQS